MLVEELVKQLLLQQVLVHLVGLNQEAIVKNNSVAQPNVVRLLILEVPSHVLQAPVKEMQKILVLVGLVILQMVALVDIGEI
jgi:hypothetical protein